MSALFRFGGGGWLLIVVQDLKDLALTIVSAEFSTHGTEEAVEAVELVSQHTTTRLHTHVKRLTRHAYKGTRQIPNG